MDDQTTYVQACTHLVDGVCQSFQWVSLPGQTWLTTENALLISAAIGGVWASCWGVKRLISIVR